MRLEATAFFCWRPSPLGSVCYEVGGHRSWVEAIATRRLEAPALRLEAIATRFRLLLRLEAIDLGLEAIATRSLEATALRLEAIAPRFRLL